MLEAANKKVYGYGASTKGNIVMNYCNLTSKNIIAISDKNPEKYNLTTPGTRIPIIPHAKLREIKPEYVFVNIWHLRNEVLKDEVDLLESGTKFIFPLPRIHVIDKNNYKRYLIRDFKDIAYTL
jgi:NDP-4-keto-2,6-dideoxyhexose 3-C-methyltransferase